MITKISVVLACLAFPLGMSRAESWRMGLELIDQWSLFTCTDIGSSTDRFWDFTLDGSRLNANGPDEVSWTATVSTAGAFKSNFTGYYQRNYQRHEYRFAAEMTGNVRTEPPWALLQNLDGMCWYKLVLQ
jgi:hypothetical protein